MESNRDVIEQTISRVFYSAIPAPSTPSFPTFFIGNPEHRQAGAMDRASLTVQGKAILPDLNPLNLACNVGHGDPHPVWPPNVPALDPRLREDDG